jgi:uncharacterized protein YbbC (DUF1343 family)
MAVITGADRIVENPALLEHKRWGIVTNYTGVTSSLELTATALHKAGAPLVAIFGPEHGTRGTAQAGFSEESEADPETGLPVYDTYLKEGAELDAIIAAADVDVLVFDMQDLGVRFYTYVWTFVDCMRSAARLGIDVVVLDRPNPLGGVKVEGPALDESGFSSFVGRVDVATRHGLTVGELLDMVTRRDTAAGLPEANLRVIEMIGWDREMLWADTGLPWVMPSPNMPTPDSALAYVGTGLFEGTLMSEGRGTTRPFELIGAPWVDSRYVETLNALELPGVRFRESWFNPTFHKFAGEVVAGVQLHILDTNSFAPVATAVAMIDAAKELYPDGFAWRLPERSAESLSNTIPFIDLLWGSDSLRTTIDAGGRGGDLPLVTTHPRDAQLLY